MPKKACTLISSSKGVRPRTSNLSSQEVGMNKRSIQSQVSKLVLLIWQRSLEWLKKMTSWSSTPTIRREP